MMLDRMEEPGQQWVGMNWTEFQLNRELRKLWNEHIVWTRAFIISAVDGLGDLDSVTDRMMRNPADMARVLAVYYGEEKADTFRILFEDHLKIAAEIIMSIQNEDAEAAKQYMDLWYANAAAMAAFLGEINDYWRSEEWNVLLKEHLDMVRDYMVIRLNKAYAEDPPFYDRMEAQALAMADLMTAGTIRQFNL